MLSGLGLARACAQMCMCHFVQPRPRVLRVLCRCAHQQTIRQVGAGKFAFACKVTISAGLQRQHASSACGPGFVLDREHTESMHAHVRIHKPSLSAARLSVVGCLRLRIMPVGLTRYSE